MSVFVVAATRCQFGSEFTSRGAIFAEEGPYAATRCENEAESPSRGHPGEDWRTAGGRAASAALWFPGEPLKGGGREGGATAQTGTK